MRMPMATRGQLIRMKAMKASGWTQIKVISWMISPAAIRIPAQRMRLSINGAATSLVLLPESCVLQIVKIMDRIVAITRHAGHLVGLDFRHHVWRFMVARLLFKGSRAEMAIKAFAVIKGSVELDFVWFRNSPEILNVDVVKAPHF